MSLFQSMISGFRGIWSRSIPGSKQVVPPFQGTGTDVGVVVTPSNALKLSAVFACVGLRADIFSTLPLHLYTRDKKIATDHPLHRLIHESPNSEMTATSFWSMMSASCDMWGNAYAKKHWNNKKDRIVALEPLRPEKISIVRSESGEIGYEHADKPGEVMSQDDVFHLHDFSIDGIVGLSPLQYAAETMGVLLEANRAAANEFRSGLKVGGFLLTGQGTLNDEQRNRLRENLGQFARPENSGKWMVLEAGMQPSSNTAKVSPVDAQLLESRYFGVEEICRAYRVPPQLIGHVSKASSWASSLENTNLYFLTYSIRPRLVRTEQAISKQLLSPSERLEYQPHFTVEGLMRSNTQARGQFYSSMVQNGLMTRNEVRELEDMPPVEGGDELTVQLNLTPLDQLGQDFEDEFFEAED